AALVEVVVDEIVRIGVRTIAHSPAPRLAALGLLDLDDVGPEPGQRLGTGRSRLELGEVEHLDPLECRLGRGRDLRLPYLILHGGPPSAAALGNTRPFCVTPLAVPGELLRLSG